MNKSTGNMYDFIHITWNTIKGECLHDCSYCYMKRWGKLNPIRFDEKELKTNLGSGNFIFVGSSNDMFAENIPFLWIKQTIDHCKKYPDNRYFLQSKNTKRILELGWLINDRIFIEENHNGHFENLFSIATTIETNRVYTEFMGNTPEPIQRLLEFKRLGLANFDKYITIEPIMKFDLDIFVKELKDVLPKQINIGADSGNNGLPEPSKENILELIKQLETFTKVKIKKNLNRLLK